MSLTNTRFSVITCNRTSQDVACFVVSAIYYWTHSLRIFGDIRKYKSKSLTLNWKNANAEIGYFRHFYMLAVTTIIRQCYLSVNTISLTSHTSKCDLWSKNDSTFLVKVWLLIVAPIFRTAVTLQKHAKYQAGANTNMQTQFTSYGKSAHVDWSTVAECSIFRVKQCKKATGPADVHHAPGGMAITLHVRILPHLSKSNPNSLLTGNPKPLSLMVNCL